MSKPASPRALRLLVPSPDRQRVLARPNGLAGWALPRITMRSSTAWSHEDDVAAAAICGTPVAPVRPVDDAHGGRAWEVEILARVPAAGTTWIPTTEGARLGSDAPLVAQWAQEAPTPYEHLQPGWRRLVEEWADDEEIERTGPTTTVRHWELAGVVEFPTATGPVVVKQPGPGFEREPAITNALAGLPGAPDVVASGAGRMATRWAGAADVADRAEVAGTIGRLARGAVDRVDALGRAGCRPVSEELPDEAMPALDRALETVAALGLPTSVVHGDAHPGNSVIDGGCVSIIDWSDAAIGCPALDLHLLIGTAVGAEAETMAETVAETVVKAWAGGFGWDAATVLGALPSLRLIAAARSLTLARRLQQVQPETAHAFWADEIRYYAGDVAQQISPSTTRR